MVAGLPQLLGRPLPISLPASKVVGGEGDVDGVGRVGWGCSSAITYRPASRAFLIALLTPGRFGVIRMPFWPCAIAFSIAWTCPCSSPSALPEATVRSTLFLAGLLLGALLHGDEERFAGVLGDQ